MDIQTISIALAGIGVFIAAVNFIITSRHAHKQRQTEIETRQAERARVGDGTQSPT